MLSARRLRDTLQVWLVHAFQLSQSLGAGRSGNVALEPARCIARGRERAVRLQEPLAMPTPSHQQLCKIRLEDIRESFLMPRGQRSRTPCFDCMRTPCFDCMRTPRLARSASRQRLRMHRPA
eukprot:6214712-Pleurochrysis_carterae.AAC.4